MSGLFAAELQSPCKGGGKLFEFHYAFGHSSWLEVKVPDKVSTSLSSLNEFVPKFKTQNKKTSYFCVFFIV